MRKIEIIPQISLTGIGLIEDALKTTFERGQYGKGLDAAEHIRIDKESLIERLDDKGCQIVGKRDVQKLESECWNLISVILKNIDNFQFSDTAEALIFCRKQIGTSIVMQRLERCQELMKYVNGYDCYDLDWDDGHPFDRAMEKALTKMRNIYEDQQKFASTTQQKLEA